MFPPGRARLATKPFATGSGSVNMTMGIVEVACLAVRVDVGPPVTITSTLRRTNSAAISASRPSFPSPYRYSITRLLPSTCPSARSPCRKASSAAARPVEELLVRNPIRGIFGCCCASALAPHMASVTTRATIPTHFRFWILRRDSVQVLDFRVSDRELEDRVQILSCICFSPQSKIGNLKSKMSFYDLVRPRQHVGRNGQADLHGRLQIDNELELHRLLDGSSAGFAPFRILSTTQRP